MLIYFSVENFRSIRDDITLSLVAGPGNEYSRSNIMHSPRGIRNTEKFRILKSAVIYGPNASGKSNLINAIATMKHIVVVSALHYGKLPITPFRLNNETANAPSTFEVMFLFNGVRYQYGFSATEEVIHEEWLYAYPNNRAQTWFERIKKPDTSDSPVYEYKFGSNLSGNKKLWKDSTRSNALFLTTAVQLNSEQLQPIITWFTERLHVLGDSQIPVKTIRYLTSHKHQEVLEFLKNADFAISDVAIEVNDSADDNRLKRNLLDFKPTLAQESPTEKYRLITYHMSDTGERIEFDLSEESDGTIRMFEFAGLFLSALEQKQVLVIDELHAHLHPLLAEQLVSIFHKNERNPDYAQLICATHETSLLNTDVFRRDQIWFCERKRDQSTELYPLTKFMPRKEIKNLENSYLGGRYGAVPSLTKDMFFR